MRKNIPESKANTKNLAYNTVNCWLLVGGKVFHTEKGGKTRFQMNTFSVENVVRGIEFD